MIQLLVRTSKHGGKHRFVHTPLCHTELLGSLSILRNLPLGLCMTVLYAGLP